MAWEFTPEQAQNHVEMANHLKEACLAYIKDRQRLLVLCWGLAYAYHACVQHPERSKRVSGSINIQVDAVANPDTQL